MQQKLGRIGGGKSDHQRHGKQYQVVAKAVCRKAILGGDDLRKYLLTFRFVGGNKVRPVGRTERAKPDITYRRTEILVGDCLFGRICDVGFVHINYTVLQALACVKAFVRLALEQRDNGTGNLSITNKPFRCGNFAITTTWLRVPHLYRTKRRQSTLSQR